MENKKFNDLMHSMYIMHQCLQVFLINERTIDQLITSNQYELTDEQLKEYRAVEERLIELSREVGDY